MELKLKDKKEEIIEPPASTQKASKLQVMQFDYVAMAEVFHLIKNLQKAVSGADNLRILGSELLTNLLKNETLYKKLDYNTGQFVWYLRQANIHERIEDKDYIVRQEDGRLITISESYFNLRFMQAVAN